jgi:hypothetical protein
VLSHQDGSCRGFKMLNMDDILHAVELDTFEIVKTRATHSLAATRRYNSTVDVVNKPVFFHTLIPRLFPGRRGTQR